MTQTQKDTPADTVAAETVRHPNRGKTHIAYPQWRDHYWVETTYCGISTTTLTARAPMPEAKATDLCRSCVRGQAATRRFA